MRGALFFYYRLRLFFSFHTTAASFSVALRPFRQRGCDSVPPPPPPPPAPPPPPLDRAIGSGLSQSPSLVRTSSGAGGNLARLTAAANVHQPRRITRGWPGGCASSAHRQGAKARPRAVDDLRSKGSQVPDPQRRASADLSRTMRLAIFRKYNVTLGGLSDHAALRDRRARCSVSRSATLITCAPTTTKTSTPCWPASAGVRASLRAIPCRPQSRQSDDRLATAVASMRWSCSARALRSNFYEWVAKAARKLARAAITRPPWGDDPATRQENLQKHDKPHELQGRRSATGFCSSDYYTDAQPPQPPLSAHRVSNAGILGLCFPLPRTGRGRGWVPLPRVWCCSALIKSSSPRRRPHRHG